MTGPLDINENISFFLVCCVLYRKLNKTHNSEVELQNLSKSTCCVAVPAWRRVQDVYFFITRIVYSSCSPFLLLRLFVFLYKIHQQSICTRGSTPVKLCSHWQITKAMLLQNCHLSIIAFPSSSGSLIVVDIKTDKSMEFTETSPYYWHPLYSL